MNPEEIIKQNFEYSGKLKLELSKNNEFINKIKLIAEKIIEVYKNGGKVLIAGNGGSAADAQHFAAELMGKYEKDRKALEAYALTVNTSNLTAIGNDYSFDEVFSRQVEGSLKKKDVFIGISTSGNSKNVILALNKANEIGASTIGLIGNDGGEIKDCCNISLIVPEKRTTRIQEVHELVYHTVCEIVESEIFPD